MGQGSTSSVPGQLFLTTLLSVCCLMPVIAATMSKTYTMKVNSTGYPVCAVETPSTVISMDASTMGGQCGVQCTVSFSCQVYQFKADTAQCELYDFLPSNSTAIDHCTAYAAPSDCIPTTVVAVQPVLFLSFTLNSTPAVSAVTYFGDLLFMAYRGIAAVFVYNTTLNQLVRNLTFSGLSSNISGLATSAATNNSYYMFISDYGAQRVFKLLQVNGSTATVVMYRDNPMMLSVNRAGNLLVPLMASRMVTEITPSGATVRQHTLTGSRSAVQQVEMSNGTWAITLIILTTRVPNLITLSVNGTITGRYRQIADSAVGRMSSAMGLAVTEQDYLLVADTNNNRLLVVNPSLSDARQLPLPVKTVSPYAISLDQSRGRLYVGEITGRVLVFDNVINVAALFNN